LERAALCEPQGHHGREEEAHRREGRREPRPRCGGLGSEDAGDRPRAAAGAGRRPHDRRRFRCPGARARAPAPRGSQGHLAMPGSLTFADHKGGKVRRASLETLSEAVRLAGTLGGTVTSVAIGPGATEAAAELGAHGAVAVHVFEDSALADYATESWARAVGQ